MSATTRNAGQDRELREAVAELAREVRLLGDAIRSHIASHDPDATEVER